MLPKRGRTTRIFVFIQKSFLSRVRRESHPIFIYEPTKTIYTMVKVIDSIHVTKANTDRLLALPCVVAVADHGDGLVVVLSKDLTNGSLRANAGDYIVQFSNGMWQRFGIEAYARLVKNPNYIRAL